MSGEPDPTKRERREAARAARLDSERNDAAAAQRRRRLTTLLALLGAAAVRSEGYGLKLLGTLASRWGVDCAKGCRVWFEVDRRPRRFGREH